MFLDGKLLEIGMRCNGDRDSQIETTRLIIRECFENLTKNINGNSKISEIESQIRRINTTLNIVLKVSTISIAEYCVRGNLQDLPLKNIQIVPFNLKEAQKTGQFASIIFDENGISKEKLTPRAIIPNDSKLFAQANLDKSITHFVTSDIRSKNTFALLKKKNQSRI